LKKVLATATAILATIGLVLPGFIVAELSRIKRSARSGEGDFELVLRALFYALLIHIVFLPWTATLVRNIGPGQDWASHVWALVPYAFVVLLIVPTLLGLALNWWLRSAEQRGNLGWIHSAFGAHDARDSFDFGFGRLTERGRYLIVRRSDGSMLAGTFGKNSWAGRAPEPHDVYLEEVRSLGPDGEIGPPLEPKHSIWLNAEAIDSIFVADPGGIMKPEHGS
jgi:hypothetical protein